MKKNTRNVLIGVIIALILALLAVFLLLFYIKRKAGRRRVSRKFHVKYSALGALFPSRG